MDFTRVLADATPLMLAGLKVTVLISLISIALGIVIGLIMCLFGTAKNRILRAISAVYIWVVRGTPMIVQALSSISACLRSSVCSRRDSD